MNRNRQLLYPTLEEALPKCMYLVAILGLGIRQGWTMSHMVKFRAAIWSFLKLTALYFTMCDIVHP